MTFLKYLLKSNKKLLTSIIFPFDPDVVARFGNSTLKFCIEFCKSIFRELQNCTNNSTQFSFMAIGMTFT